jgi:hypothetical protein
LSHISFPQAQVIVFVAAIVAVATIATIVNRPQAAAVRHAPACIIMQAGLRRVKRKL